MGKRNPLNLSVICQMTNKLSKDLPDSKKRKKYNDFSKLLLELLDVESLDDAKKAFEQIRKDDQIIWNIEKLAKEEIFEVVSVFPLIISTKEPVTINSFIEKLESLLKNRNPNINKKQIKKTICYMILLNVVEVTCSNANAFLEKYKDEEEFLRDAYLHPSSNNKKSFLNLLFCFEIFCTNIPTIKFIFEMFNYELYNAAVITNINTKNDSICKRSKENEEKTSNFYSKILEIVGLLIAVFSIIGVNCFTLTSQNNIDIFNILLINASLVISIVLVLFLSHNIIHSSSTKKYYVVFFLTFLFFVGTLIAFFIKSGKIG